MGLTLKLVHLAIKALFLKVLSEEHGHQKHLGFLLKMDVSGSHSRPPELDPPSTGSCGSTAQGPVFP